MAKWAKVGVLWNRPSGYSGSISLGILGEINIQIKPNSDKRNDNEPDYNIIALRGELPLNQLGRDTSISIRELTPCAGKGTIKAHEDWRKTDAE